MYLIQVLNTVDYIQLGISMTMSWSCGKASQICFTLFSSGVSSSGVLIRKQLKSRGLLVFRSNRACVFALFTLASFMELLCASAIFSISLIAVFVSTWKMKENNLQHIFSYTRNRYDSLFVRRVRTSSIIVLQNKYFACKHASLERCNFICLQCFGPKSSN